MNSEAAGAIEALAWVQRTLDHAKNLTAKREVQAAKDAALDLAGVDFRERIRNRR